ncbi:MAG: hypothetical protein OIF58_05165 [Cohaesibacter sp.]|nr:hypothetical protein [Cohaesibacter sp.]
MFFSAWIAVTPAQAYRGGLTTDIALKVMEKKELHAYISGLVEGLAYARYVQDGKDADKGMKCILDWYYKTEEAAPKVLRAFVHFKGLTANAVVGALIKKECGQ